MGRQVEEEEEEEEEEVEKEREQVGRLELGARGENLSRGAGL